MSGIQLLDDKRKWLSRVRREVESQGKKMLLHGLDQMVCEKHKLSLLMFSAHDMLVQANLFLVILFIAIFLKN